MLKTPCGPFFARGCSQQKKAGARNDSKLIVTNLRLSRFARNENGSCHVARRPFS